MRKSFVTLILLCLAIAAPGADSQDKKPEPPKPAAIPLAPEALQVKVLKAEIALKDAQGEIANLNSRWQALQGQAKDIQAEAPAIQKKVQDAQAAYDKEIAESAKAIGIDPTKYDWDRTARVWNPKATPAPATPSPEKK